MAPTQQHSDGRHSIRKAVAGVFPWVPHQLCRFHSLREAARTDDGRPPLDASGLKLHGRLGAIVGSPGRAEKGAYRPS